MTCFAVITEIPDNCGNCVTSVIYVNPNPSIVVGSRLIVHPPDHITRRMGESLKMLVDSDSAGMIDLSKEQVIMCNVPAFSLGEIMVLGSDGRTIPDGRNPDKWFVEYECFNDLESAIKRSIEVFK